MKLVVFVGPTLTASDVLALVEARVCPPAMMGDIYRVIEQERPDTIALIDGVFDSVPAVWHKEILFALSRGVRVLGAASMGALRAAELWPFGMHGVGSVYDAFRSGELTDDDEVALTHADASEGYRCLSEAMVNLRAGLRRAAERGLITQQTAAALTAAAKRRYYPERSWEAVLFDGKALGRAAGELDALRAFVKLERPDVKREDAIALLTSCQRAQDREATPPPAFRSTIFWDKLVRGAHGERPPSPAGAAESQPQLRDDALLLHLAQREFEARGKTLSQASFDASLRKLRERHRLFSAESMRTWLEQRGVGMDAFRAAMTARAYCDALLDELRHEVDVQLPSAFVLAGADQDEARKIQ